jgi:hypothetical protein
MSDDEKYSRLPESDPRYAAVGLVASGWALLEARIDETIAWLAEADEKKIACITAQLIGPAKRMDALISPGAAERNI